MVAATSGLGGGEGTAEGGSGSTALPPPSAGVRYTAAPPAVFRFGGRYASWWAPVERAVVARSRPSADAPAVARIPLGTPEGTANVVRLLERVERADGLWLRVGLAALPNDETGWVRRGAVGGYHRVTDRLVVSLHKLTATFYRGRRAVFTARIGVGRARWPTPTGEFLVRNKLTRYASPAYGPVAFGTSARSAVLTDWPAGGFVGIHGTNRPSLIPGRISHGCIRLRNADILRLARLMRPGTPVTIR